MINLLNICKHGKIIFSLNLLTDREIWDLICYSRYEDSIFEEMFSNPLIEKKFTNRYEEMKNGIPIAFKLYKCRLVKMGAYKVYLSNRDYFQEKKNLILIKQKNLGNEPA